ncbi:hypothetical protein ACFWPA_04045 [Rhodococcus sp. NPDC058505]|uniref:hypothetical protein n=1 Tax=unclassified Rhodococcus (in: high G+C Gram-positive bacteria) TaxID=192944 RepID=UPI00364DEADB
MTDRSTVRVGHLDVMHSRTRITAIIGPVELPPVDVVADRLAAMAAVGPNARLGLHPSPVSNRWTFDPAAHRPTVRRVAPPRSPMDLYDPEPDAAAPAPEPDDHRPRPTSIILAGDYLRTDHSHGLGEVALALAMHGVILGTIDPTDPNVWRPSGRRGSGIAAAAARTYGTDPRRLFALRSALHRRPESAPPETIPWIPARSGAAATMPPETVARLRAWRDGNDPSVSMFAVIAAALHRGLAASGIEIDDVVTVTLDARRYLPKGRVPLGNFVSGLEFDLGRAPTPRRIHRASAGATASGRPVANLALNAARTRVGLRTGRQADTRWDRPRHPRARLLFSSLGVVPRTGRVPWRDTAAPFYAAHNDPTGPDGITVTWAIVEGAVIASASFHGNVFPRAQVQEGLTRAVTDPLALLT